MKFRFKKNNRGYSDLTFPFLRGTIISTTRLIFRPILENPENMPRTGPCFLFGNHSNYFDPFLLNVWSTGEPTAGVMTREQFHKTLPALFMDSIGIVPTSKYVPEPGVIRQVMRMIDQRRMIVIFPEGGRRWDGNSKPLIESTLKLFYRMKIPVHPVQIHGSYLTWPRWADYPRLGRTIVTWLKPLLPSDYPDYETFAEVCRSAIDFDEYNAPEVCHPKRAFRPASGIQRLLYRCPETGKYNGVFSPDGHYVLSRFSRWSYEMNAASRLVDANGEIHSLMDTYARVKGYPIVPDGPDGAIIAEKGTAMFRVDENHQLHRLPDGTASLFEDTLRLKNDEFSRDIPLDDILYQSIEQNNKISITGKDFVYQFYSSRYSALQWQHFLRRLKSGEKTVNSL